MDPNATLTALRALASKEPTGDLDARERFNDMRELFEALDGWLSRGGFLPTDWSANR